MDAFCVLIDALDTNAQIIQLKGMYLRSDYAA